MRGDGELYQEAARVVREKGENFGQDARSRAGKEGWLGVAAAGLGERAGPAGPAGTHLGSREASVRISTARLAPGTARISRVKEREGQGRCRR